MTIYSIYRYTNPINDKVYIGKTENTEQRRLGHIRAAHNNSQSTFHRAIRLYGIEQLTYEIIDTSATNQYEHNILECYFIKMHDCCIIDGADKGYNMTRGGDGGDTSHSPNYKAAILARESGGSGNPMFGKFGVNNPNYGRKNTEETKQVQSVAQAANWKGNDERRLIASRNSSGSNNSQYGKKPKNAKSITINGVEYLSLSDAKRETNISIYKLNKLLTNL